MVRHELFKLCLDFPVTLAREDDISNFLKQAEIARFEKVIYIIATRFPTTTIMYRTSVIQKYYCS